MANPPASTHQEISERAYFLWLERGRPEGQSDEIWFTAENELAGRYGSLSSPGDRAPGHFSQPAAVPTNLDRALEPAERRRVRAERNVPATPTESRPRPPHFVVVIDRAHLRIFEHRASPGQFSPALHEVEAVDFPEGRSRYSARDTDQQGRFPGSRGQSAGMSIDERLPAAREHERRIEMLLARTLNEFLQRFPTSAWDYAAPSTLYRAVLDRLDAGVRTRMRQGVPKDLTGQPTTALMNHFITPPTSTAEGAA